MYSTNNSFFIYAAIVVDLVNIVNTKLHMSIKLKSVYIVIFALSLSTMFIKMEILLVKEGILAAETYLLNQ